MGVGSRRREESFRPRSGRGAGMDGCWFQERFTLKMPAAAPLAVSDRTGLEAVSGSGLVPDSLSSAALSVILPRRMDIPLDCLWTEPSGSDIQCATARP